MLGVDRPRHVLRGDLAIVGGIGHAGVRPVLGVDEVGALEGFPLIILHVGSGHKLGVELVALGMGDDEVDVGRQHPLGEGVGHGLRQGLGVGGPGEDDLGARNCGSAAAHRTGGILLDGDEVGEGLERMDRGGLHGEDRPSAVAYELLDDGLGIVVVAVGEAGEGADADDVAVAAHDGDGLKQMLRLVAVHDDAALGLEFPCPLVDVEHDDVHSQVHGSLLRGETGAQRVVEENHQERLVAPQLTIFITILLDLLCLGQCLRQRPQVFYVDECSHA